MDVSTLPSLDLAFPQAKTELSKQYQGFMEWSVDKRNTDKKHHTTNAQVIIDSNFSYIITLAISKKSLKQRCIKEFNIGNGKPLFLVREQLTDNT